MSNIFVTSGLKTRWLSQLKRVTAESRQSWALSKAFSVDSGVPPSPEEFTSVLRAMMLSILPHSTQAAITPSTLLAAMTPYMVSNGVHMSHLAPYLFIAGGNHQRIIHSDGSLETIQLAWAEWGVSAWTWVSTFPISVNGTVLDTLNANTRNRLRSVPEEILGKSVLSLGNGAFFGMPMLIGPQVVDRYRDHIHPKAREVLRVGDDSARVSVLKELNLPSTFCGNFRPSTDAEIEEQFSQIQVGSWLKMRDSDSLNYFEMLNIRNEFHVALETGEIQSGSVRIAPPSAPVNTNIPSSAVPRPAVESQEASVSPLGSGSLTFNENTTAIPRQSAPRPTSAIRHSFFVPYGGLSVTTPTVDEIDPSDFSPAENTQTIPRIFNSARPSTDNPL